MNLEQSISVEALQMPVKKPVEKRMTAEQMAEHVFKISAAAGHPFEKITAKQWARRWLSSPEFVLTEVEADRVALIRTPRNTNQVLRNMAAAKDSQEPIVVDLNKQGLGSINGYVPKVIAVDGAHRAYGQYLVGRDILAAWVGVKALNKVKVQPLISAAAIKKATPASGSKITTAAILAAQGLPQPTRQDAGDGGPSATGTAVPPLKSGVPTGSEFIKNRGVRAGGPGSGRHAEGGDTRGFTPDRQQYKAYPHFDYNNQKSSFKCKNCGEGPFTNVDDMYKHLEDRHPSVVHATGSGGGAGGAATGSTGGPGGATSGANPMFIHGKKKKKVKAARRTPEARSTGQLEPPDPSDEKVPPDPSDAGQSVEPSDRQQYVQKPQVMTPGTRKLHNNEHRGPQSPMSQSPGSGVGPRLDPDAGASGSEMSRKLKAKGCKACGKKMDAAAKRVAKIVADYTADVKAGKFVHTMKNVTPPGCEDAVQGLKKSGVDNPWAVAWWMKSKGRC